MRLSVPVWGLLAVVLAGCATTNPAIPDGWSRVPETRTYSVLSYGAGGVLQYQSAPPRRLDVRTVSSPAGVHLAKGDLVLTPDFAAIDSFDVSDDRKEVVFSAKRKDNFDIGLVSVDGSEVHWVPSDPADEVAVQWAPRGNKISYVVRARGGDVVRTVHIPTSTAVTSEFENGDVHALAWEPGGERYAVAWSSVDASERVEVMRYDGEERKVLAPPSEKLDMTIDALGGAIVLRPSALQYNERVPLVVWVTPEPNRWDDARGWLEKQKKVAVAIVKRSPESAFWAAAHEAAWIDWDQIYVVNGAAPPGGTSIIGDLDMPDGHYRVDAGHVVRVPPGVVKSFAARYIAHALERNAPIHGSQ